MNRERTAIVLVAAINSVALVPERLREAGSMFRASKTLLQRRYRDQLVRELESLEARKHVEWPPEIAALMEAVAREKCRITQTKYHWWRQLLPTAVIRRDDLLPASDLYLLEAALIEHLDQDELRIRVAGYRDLLSHLLTDDSYAMLTSSLKDPPSGNEADWLLSEARALISRLYRRYEGVPAVEKIRSGTAMWIVTLTVSIVFVAWTLSQLGVASTTLAVGACGSIGAAVSTMGRLYKLDARQEPFGMWLALESGRFTLLLSPVLGFVFALVLLVLVRAEVVGGTLVTADGCWSLLGGGHCSLSETDFAKLLGLGFLAGWAERMVPDILDRLVPQSAGGAKTK